MINISKYKKQLFEIVDLFAPIIEEVLIVPSIKEWCSAKGITESSEDRVSKCLLNLSTGRHLILISEVISEGEKASTVGAMSFHGSAEEDIESLGDELAFVKHLLLRECAHAFNKQFSKHQCDCWAFDRIKEIAI